MAAAALLWPSRLAGILDGAPLDGRLDALVIGLALPALIVIDRRLLKSTAARGLVMALLIWKASLAATVAPDGWCLRFVSPVAVFVDGVTVPHAWDVRADWRSRVPACSAVMTRGYHAIEEFPVWFYNLPPANFESPSRPEERPPLATPSMQLSGSLRVAAAGVFKIESGEGMALAARIDGQPVAAAQLRDGVSLAGGSHDIAIDAQLSGERWRLLPTWNGRDVWRSAVSTLRPSGAIEAWLRPAGAWLQAGMVLSLLALALGRLLRRLRDTATMAAMTASGATAVASLAHVAAMRTVPAVFALSAALRMPRRLQNLLGAQVLIAIPFLALVAAYGYEGIGRATWYSVGDDWWMFQRFAYRIYLQGFWLEGGEPVFWFQPLYRWIAGALHMVFGDSSVGELFWDGACALAGAMFAFHVCRVVAGFRAGLIAAALTLALFTIGPGWYLFGRGLSEITSMGLLYSAALLAMRGRAGGARWMLASGLCLVLGVFTRLNNLPFAVAIAAFCLPVRQPAAGWWRWRTWWPRHSPPVLWGTAAAVACAILVFSARTYYFTGDFNPLAGTQASARSVWQESDAGETPIENAANSVLLVITMSDPPRLEPRGLPLVLAIAGSLLALAGIGRFRYLPLNLTLMCLAGIAGAFVARGSAYPGRFSIHLIPVAAALTVCIAALLRPRKAPR